MWTIRVDSKFDLLHPRGRSSHSRRLRYYWFALEGSTPNRHRIRAAVQASAAVGQNSVRAPAIRGLAAVPATLARALCLGAFALPGRFSTARGVDAVAARTCSRHLSTMAAVLVALLRTLPAGKSAASSATIRCSTGCSRPSRALVSMPRSRSRPPRDCWPSASRYPAVRVTLSPDGHRSPPREKRMSSSRA